MNPEPALDRPIVILGAARSGTKALRAALAAHPALTAVPHDVNYIWKYGHYRVPHDELRREQLTPGISRTIRRWLARFGSSEGGVRLVEKTVSNTLRVGYVRAILPECRFLHLVRDGRDVAASARRSWQAPPDWGRLGSKLRTFPLAAVPRYGTEYLRSYLARIIRRRGQVRSWGPRFAGIDEAVARLPLLSVCGLQWRKCVEAASSALGDLPEADRLEVRYEDLARRPDTQLERVYRFLGLEPTTAVVQRAAKTLTVAHIGKWRRAVEPRELGALLETIGPTLEQLGYPGGTDPV